MDIKSWTGDSLGSRKVIKRKPEAVGRGRPPAVQGPEDRRQVLPFLVSCQKEGGPLIPG